MIYTQFVPFFRIASITAIVDQRAQRSLSCDRCCSPLPFAIVLKLSEDNQSYCSYGFRNLVNARVAIV